MLATFTKSIKKVELPALRINKGLSMPAVVVYLMIMIGLWLLAR